MLGMLGRTRLLSALLVTGSLFLAACQPTVNVSRATARLQPAPPAPRDPRLVPVRPSAIEGRRVFQRAQCVVCHGPEGLGNGPAAANLKSPGKNLMTDFFRLIGIRLRGDQLPSRPANFHNPVAMRLNSPFSMYETVTRGRPHTAMPAFPRKGGKPAYGAASFGGNLTDRGPAAKIRGGNRLEETKRSGGEGPALPGAACHGTAGNGRGPRGAQLSRELWHWARGQGPGIFTDINLMAQRKPTELYQAIVDGRGRMPAYRGKLADDEIWAVVNYLYTFVYDYPWGEGAGR